MDSLVHCPDRDRFANNLRRREVVVNGIRSNNIVRDLHLDYCVPRCYRSGRRSLAYCS